MSHHTPNAPFMPGGRTAARLLLAALMAVAACSETEVVDNLHLRISSDRPESGATLEDLNILFVKGDTRFPAVLTEPAFNPSLAGLDPVAAPVLISLGYDGQTFGDGKGVTLQVLGRTGQVVQTRFEGVVDLGASKIIEVRLRAVPAGCDNDADGFLDCSNPACCAGPSPLSDCHDDELGANAWATAPACIPCGSAIDYNCDGQVEACVDEDRDGIADCQETCGAGDPTVGPGLPELCDGKDNNCDGQIDEGFELGGEPLGGSCTAPGECGQGVVECGSSNTVVCSTGPGGSASRVSEEVCDGLDNNCDGTTDEGFNYEGQALGEACQGRGECGVGIVECAAGRTDVATCSTNSDGSAHVPALEVCNGLDDNCDGQTDEDLSAPDSDCIQVGVCATGVVATCDQGVWACDYSQVQGYQEVETLCDGLDNDCDGETDEGFAYEGEPIGGECDGLGACGMGRVECEAGRTDRATCSTNPGGSDHIEDGEICDGIDNDCDGEIDEGFAYEGAVIGAACDGRGVCGAGVVVCAIGRTDLATCSTNADGPASQASPEICDTLDNDCDGQTDEALTVVDSDCKQVGVCGAALDRIVATCAGGQWSCDYAAVPNYQANETRCDARDNDCDGQTDEGYTYSGLAVGEACQGVGECGAGVVQCAVGREDLATCSTNPNGSASQASAEVCDTRDNDCDGQTDEDFNYLGIAVGEACEGVGECGAGVVECRNTAGATCSTNADGSASQATREICDAKDNDCDGQTDEGLSFADSSCLKVGVCGEALDLIVAACTPAGEWTCDYSAVPHYQAVETACDGRDNDCDGEADEPFRAGGTVSYTDELNPADIGLVLGDACGAGLCAGGAVVCNSAGDALTCSTIGARTEETCNDLDDNCDGSTDEPYTALLEALDENDIGKVKGDACGTGLCAGGAVVCNAAGDALICNSEAQVEDEICDGEDNDCDGNIDEGFANDDGDEYADCVDPCIDVDGDGVCSNAELDVCVGGESEDCRDNCPEVYNPDQSDSDGDGKGDACDLCPKGPSAFEVCGDCIDNNCSGEIDEADCAERRIITIATRDEALPAGYPVSLVLDHQTLVRAGWSSANGDDVRIFYRDPTLNCDDTDPLSCSVELDRIADPLAPFNTNATQIWFALQAPLPAKAATTQYELYYNVGGMTLPMADEAAIFHMADLFDRPDSTTVGNGWLELNQQANDYAITSSALYAGYGGNQRFTPVISRTFDPISASSPVARFELRLGHNWQAGDENSWAVLMQLGKADAYAAVSAGDRWPNAGVGVSLAHGGGSALGNHTNNTLASVSGGITNAPAFNNRRVMGTPGEIYVSIDFRGQSPTWRFDNGGFSAADVNIPFASAQDSLDSIRFILHEVSGMVSQRSWRHVILRPAVDAHNEPMVFLGIKEPLGTEGSTCALATPTFRYRMDGAAQNPITTNALDSTPDGPIHLFRAATQDGPNFVQALSHWAARFGAVAGGGRYLSAVQNTTSKLFQFHGASQLTWEFVVDNNHTATDGSTAYPLATLANGDHTASVQLALLNNSTVQASLRLASGGTSVWTWNVPALAQSRRGVLHLVFNSNPMNNNNRLRLYYDGAQIAASNPPTLSRYQTIYLYNGSGNSAGNQALLAVGNVTGSNPNRSPMADIYWFASYPQALDNDTLLQHVRVLTKDDDR